MTVSSYRKLSSRGIKGMIMADLEKSDEMDYPAMIGTNPLASDQEIETYEWVASQARIRSFKNGRAPTEYDVYELTIKNEPFEASVDVPKVWVDRDKTGQIRERIGELGEEGNEHWGELITDLIENGETELGYDETPYFGTTHQQGKSGVFANYLIGSSTAWLNVSDPENPTAAELAIIAMRAVQHMRSWKKGNGKAANRQARRFGIMVPNNMEAAMETALTATLMGSGTGSYTNTTAESDRLKFEMIPNGNLTFLKKLYVFRLDKPNGKAFIRQQEKDYQIASKAEGSEYEFDTGRWQFGIDASRGVGYGDHYQALELELY